MKDHSASYVLAAKAPFDSLRALATQLAGVVLMKAIDPRERQIQDTPLQHFDERFREAMEALAALPPCHAAAHHHHHLRTAAKCLASARGLIDRSLVLTRRHELAGRSEAALNAAIAHLRHASRSLPGFEMVDLGGACCALHSHPGAAPLVSR